MRYYVASKKNRNWCAIVEAESGGEAVRKFVNRFFKVDMTKKWRLENIYVTIEENKNVKKHDPVLTIS